jgi:hypothetical protein
VGKVGVSGCRMKYRAHLSYISDNNKKIYNKKEGVMKKEQTILIKMVIGLALTLVLIACASQPGKSGFLKDYYNNMGPGPGDGAKMRWLKPGVDFGKYNKVMLDSVVFYFADDSEYKGIDPVVLTELSEAFNLAVVNALKDKYSIVAEPGPDVIRIKIALTGIKQSYPVLSVVTSVVPIGLGISILKKGATGSWTGSGATSAEFMALDSISNDVIVAAQDEQTAGFIERFSKYGSAKDAFEFWAKRIRIFMDQAHGVK